MLRRRRTEEFRREHKSSHSWKEKHVEMEKKIKWLSSDLHFKGLCVKKAIMRLTAANQ